MNQNKKSKMQMYPIKANIEDFINRDDKYNSINLLGIDEIGFYENTTYKVQIKSDNNSKWIHYFSAEPKKIYKDPNLYIKHEYYGSSTRINSLGNVLTVKGIHEKFIRILNEKDIIFTDDIIKYIIINYTKNEEGVRNLKRCLEIIYTKLNLLRLVKSDNIIFYNLLGLKTSITFPITLTNEFINRLIQKPETEKIPFGMYN